MAGLLANPDVSVAAMGVCINTSGERVPALGGPGMGQGAATRLRAGTLTLRARSDPCVPAPTLACPSPGIVWMFVTGLPWPAARACPTRWGRAAPGWRAGRRGPPAPSRSPWSWPQAAPSWRCATPGRACSPARQRWSASPPPCSPCLPSACPATASTPRCRASSGAAAGGAGAGPCCTSLRRGCHPPGHVLPPIWPCRRGSGRQETGALTNIFSYWAVGIPSAAYLAFRCGRPCVRTSLRGPGPPEPLTPSRACPAARRQQMGVHGLWWGLVITNTLQGIVMTVVALRFDYAAEAAKQQQARVAAHHPTARPAAGSAAAAATAGGATVWALGGGCAALTAAGPRWARGAGCASGSSGDAAAWPAVGTRRVASTR